MNLHAYLELDGSTYDLHDLSAFEFTTARTLDSTEGIQHGVLVFGNSRMDIEFRVRKNSDGRSICSFANFPIRSKEAIEKYLDKIQVVEGVDSLGERSYDELAQGLDSEQPAQTTAVAAAAPRTWQFKSLAMIIMVFLMLGLTVLAIIFMRSRSSLSVSNAALVGNYLPVNAKMEGEIADVLVIEGQQVLKGDLLMRLKNPEIESTRIQARAARDSAKLKVKALQTQLDNYQRKLLIADKKFALDMEVAKSEMVVADKTRQANRARVELMKPFLDSGSVTQLEYDEALEKMLASEAMVITAENKVRQVQFSLEAASNGILILGDRVDDEAGRITTELDIAKAELQELQVVFNETESQVKQLDIVAPRDGQVYSTYRQPGEFLRIADEALAISFPGKTWVAGHLTPSQANRVRPGQPVRVSFPSMDMELEGVVMGVGHRSMYSKGFYNADFRGTTATDVPIKVRIDDLPQEVPSGMRVELAVSTGFGVEWLDDYIGFELKPLFEQADTVASELASRELENSNSNASDSRNVASKSMVPVTPVKKSTSRPDTTKVSHNY